MALNSFDTALTDAAAVKTLLTITGSTEDARIDAIIADVSAWISQYCGRKFAQTTYTDEIYDGTGSPTLYLRNFPVTSPVTSIYLDSTAKWASTSLLVEDTSSVTGTYRVRADEDGMGRVQRLGDRLWTKGFGNVKVSYQGGHAVIPTVIADAAIRWTVRIKQLQKAGSWGVTQESTSGGGSRSYLTPSDMPPEVLEMVKPWRRARDLF